MTNGEKIKQGITNFVKGGDNSDTVLLDKILHSDFIVNYNGFMRTAGVTIINKEKYLTNIRNGVFGGLPRKLEIENTDKNESIAMVKLSLKNPKIISYRITR